MANDLELSTLEGLTLYSRSVTHTADVTVFLARRGEDQDKLLGVVGQTEGFEGALHRQGEALLCPLTAKNAAALRERLSWLRPMTLGLQTSVGFGDRLGIGTPGHVRAKRAANLAPIYAQQSVRENARTGRSPQEVLDDATWGVFQEGATEAWGADADHLKSAADLDAFVAAGYTLFTVDPGDRVDDAAGRAGAGELEHKVQALPWEALEDTRADMERRYLGRSLDVGTTRLSLDREALWRAAAKYGRAIVHTVDMYRRLVATRGGDGFELEVSVDETETPTTPEEHLFIANELSRLGVRWVSLAPRFVGRFEKGVDYIGDIEQFASELERHAAVAQALGPYKLSLHSGSDKFSLYPLLARVAGGLVHVKTAGTSYLEALRAVACISPGLFREILRLSRERYPTDKATYHVSAELGRVPAPDGVGDADLPGVLDQFDARQVLHVTYGSVLGRFGDELMAALRDQEKVYYELLEAHFARHLAAFVDH